MNFISTNYLLFFLVVYLFTIFFKSKKKLYKSIILISNITFYSFFGLKYSILLLGSITVNFIFLKLIKKLENSSYKKKQLILFITLNVILLAIFKYYTVLISSYIHFFNSELPLGIKIISLIIPPGLSFYTFRTISHLIDTYKGRCKNPSWTDYAIYVSYFPQIISGPLEKPSEFYAKLEKPINAHEYKGDIILLLILGIIKKYVIASFLFDYVAGPFSTPENYSQIDLIIGSLSYTIMLYVDFSGYSDLSIAMSTLLGIRVRKNFDSPYSAIGIKDFWNRWHISLSIWLKDYLYIPLGGSRKGLFRKYMNVMITMIISGLWHGAGLNFLLWGMLHGLGSVVTNMIENFLKKIKIITNPVSFWSINLVRFLKIIGWAITFIFISFTWIFFNARDINLALRYLETIIYPVIKFNKYIDARLLFVIWIVIRMNFIEHKTTTSIKNLLGKIPNIILIPFLMMFIYVILKFGPETVPPFIYFNF